MELPPPDASGTSYWGDVVDAPVGAYGNYVGPYWSDGKRQTSVKWGELAPVDEYDAAARRHDAAYANWPDDKHRMAADLIFMDEVKKEDKKTGRSMASDPAFAGKAVVYGNYTARRAKEIAAAGGSSALTGMAMNAGKNFLKAGALGLVGVAVGEVKHLYEMNKMLKYQKEHGPQQVMREQEDVRDFYKTAPKPTKYSAKASSTAAKQQVDDIQDKLVPRDSTAVEKGSTNSVRVTPLKTKGQQDTDFPPTHAFLSRKLALRQYKKLKTFLGLKQDVENQKKNSIVPTPHIQTKSKNSGQKQTNMNLAKPARFRFRNKNRVGVFQKGTEGR